MTVDGGLVVPTLKCVTAWSGRRHLCDLVGDELGSLAGEGAVLRLGDDSYLVYTPLEATEIRDSLRARLEEGESLLVVEFERWSGYGPGIDRGWLLSRGH